MNPSDVKRAYQMRLLVEEAIDDLLPQLVAIVSKQLDPRSLGRAQFSTLVGITRETSSPEIILNWLRYQIGRQKAWQENAFGTTLLSLLDTNVREISEQIARDLLNEHAVDERTGRRLMREVYLNMLRQVAGQLQRCVLGYQRG